MKKRTKTTPPATKPMIGPIPNLEVEEDDSFVTVLDSLIEVLFEELSSSSSMIHPLLFVLSHLLLAYSQSLLEYSHSLLEVSQSLLEVSQSLLEDSLMTLDSVKL